MKKILCLLLICLGVVSCNSSNNNSLSDNALIKDSSSSLILSSSSELIEEASSSSEIFEDTSSSTTKEKEFKQFFIEADVYNVSVGSNQMAIFTDYEIDGNLPDISVYSPEGQTRYKAMNYTWSTPIAVDEEGKITLIGFKWYQGYGGSYDGHDKTYSGLTQYPDMLNKNNPGLLASENWEGWPSDNRNFFDFVVPENGFVILLNGNEKINTVLASIFDNEDIKEKNIEGGSYNNQHLMTDFSIPEDVRLSLDENNNLVVSHGTLL